MSDDEFRGFALYRQVGPSKHLTARLSHRGAQWVLCVYIAVEFYFSVSYAAQLKGARDWTESEMEEWKNAFIKSGEATFSYRWSLQACVAKDKASLRGPLLVDVEVVIVEADTSGMTRTADVYKVFVTRQPLEGGLESEGIFRPEIQLSEGHTGLHKTPHAPEWLLQRASDHEIGHALGMVHPRCKENNLYCYGDPKEESGQDLMGMGQHVSVKDYLVFAEILEEIAPDRHWMVVGNSFGPSLERHQSWLRKPGPYPSSVPGPRGLGKPAVKHRHRKRIH
jgi:hypothetical protein